MAKVFGSSGNFIVGGSGGSIIWRRPAPQGSTTSTALIQAIVEPIAIVPDGNLIQFLEPAWNAIAARLATDPHALLALSPRQLEELVAASYDKAGYDEVILTPHSGDYGRDVIAMKKGWGSIRILDQVKAFSPGHLVTANDIRSLLGVLQGDRAASKGVVTTTSSFAPRVAEDPTIQPFVPYRLELIDGKMLAARMQALTGSS